MTAEADEITQFALTLPVEQRAQVANALLTAADEIVDTVLAHDKRLPGYWRERVGE